MQKYCQAYYLKDLRRFQGWLERANEQGQTLNENDIVYLQDNFTVVASPITPEKYVVFDTVTPEWRSFCTHELQFAIPDDLLYAYQQEPAVSVTSTASV